MISKGISTVILAALFFTGLPAFAESEFDGDEDSELTTTASSVNALPDMASLFTTEGPSIEAGGLSATNITGEYRVGPQDVIEIEVFGVPELSDSSVIDIAGEISMPLMGDIFVSGMTTKEIEAKIEKLLGKDYLQDPHVNVDITDYQSQLVTLDGSIGRPGIYPLKGRTTFHQIIVSAGGMAKLANPNEVVIFRKIEGQGTVAYVIDYEKVRDNEIPDPLLMAGDVVVVSESSLKSAFYGGAALITTATKWMIFL